MDERTLTALQGSIAKWEAIVAGTGADNGAANCPLCEQFYPENEDEADDNGTACDGCPVKEQAGAEYCFGSPYDDWSDLFVGKTRPYTAETPEQKAAAQAELDFLRSLLPVKEPA